MQTQELIDEYILLFHKGELSQEQQTELTEWLQASPANRNYFRKAMNFYTCVEISGESNLINEMQSTVKNRLYKRIHRKRILNFAWKISGAAAILVVMIGSVLLWYHTKSEVPVLIEEFGKVGSSKAILTLANGEEISLTEKGGKYITTPEGHLMRQDSTGHLHIQAIDSNQLKQAKTLDNTVWVPQGGEYQLTLSDGTEVWLNAETKLKFPTQFVGNKRVVELSGCAYFDVAENESKPFVIRTGELDVRVLGTSFGVRSYQDENEILTTLVSGSVRVYSPQGDFLLTPSHQACYDKKTKNVHIKQVDTELYTGWKDGKLLYDNCPLEEILGDLKRWYSFDVSYANNEVKKIPFTLNIRKHEKITGVLELMQKTERVHFEIEGNRIIVK